MYLIYLLILCQYLKFAALHKQGRVNSNGRTKDLIYRVLVQRMI
jgi:hypothetical protein